LSKTQFRHITVYFDVRESARVQKFSLSIPVIERDANK